MGDSFGDKASASWSDWISGDWLRGRSVMPSTRLLEASFGVTSRLLGGPGGTRQAMSAMIAPAAMLQRLVEQLRTQTLGRLVSIVTSRAEISLALEELGVNPSPLELALGHLGDLQVSARDVTWGGRRVDRLIVTARNVHVRPGRNAVLVAAPVDVTVTICQASLDDWLGPSRHARLNLLDDAVAISRRGQELWGSVEVEPRVGPSDLSFIPTALSLRSRRIQVPRHLPAVLRLRLPPLPRELVIRKIEVRQGILVVTGLVPEIREVIEPYRLQQLARLAEQGAARFTVDDLAPRADDG